MRGAEHISAGVERQIPGAYDSLAARVERYISRAFRRDDTASASASNDVPASVLFQAIHASRADGTDYQIGRSEYARARIEDQVWAPVQRAAVLRIEGHLGR